MKPKYFTILMILSLFMAACGGQGEAPESAQSGSAGVAEVQPGGEVNTDDMQDTPDVDYQEQNELLDDVNRGGPGVPEGDGEAAPPDSDSASVPGQEALFPESETPKSVEASDEGESNDQENADDEATSASFPCASVIMLLGSVSVLMVVQRQRLYEVLGQS